MKKISFVGALDISGRSPKIFDLMNKFYWDMKILVNGCFSFLPMENSFYNHSSSKCIAIT